MALAGRVRDPQRRAVDVDRLGDLERADDERDEVGRHLHRVGEADRDAGRRRVGSRPTSAALDSAVRSSSTTSVIAKTALISGSSQHGKARRASVASNWVVAMTWLVAVVVGEGGAVEAVQLVVEDAAEAGVQRGLARPASVAARARVARSVRLVVGRRSASSAGAVGRLDPGLVDLELDGVEHDLAERPRPPRRSTVSAPAKVTASRSGSRVMAYREGTTVRGRRYWSATRTLRGRGRQTAILRADLCQSGEIRTPKR